MVERVSDFKMPEKVVTRLLKDALPDNVLVSKDAKNAACRSASIFILQLSIAAAEKAQMSKRRTLDNQDIISAVTDLGLAECAPQLVRFAAQRKRNAKRKESSLLKTKTVKKPVHEDTSSTLHRAPASPAQEADDDSPEPTDLQNNSHLANNNTTTTTTHDDNHSSPGEPSQEDDDDDHDIDQDRENGAAHDDDDEDDDQGEPEQL